MSKIPKNLQGKLWSRKIDELNLQKDKNYIIHQILQYGNLQDIKWLFKVYSAEQIKNEFIKQPRKGYSKPGFNFIKNFILKLTEKSIDENKYLRNSPRIIRQK